MEGASAPAAAVAEPGIVAPVVGIGAEVLGIVAAAGPDTAAGEAGVEIVDTEAAEPGTDFPEVPDLGSCPARSHFLAAVGIEEAHWPSSCLCAG